jgi:uncharacterized protein (DUF952 family)
MLIYKIAHRADWETAEQTGRYDGSAKDLEDGFIHFSTAAQVAGTLMRFYAGASDLLLVAVEADGLGAALRYEAASDGGMFPHLYGALPLSAVRWNKPIARNRDGSFDIPTEET